MLRDIHMGANEFGDLAVGLYDGVREDVEVANGAVVQNDAVVQFEIAGVADGVLNGFPNGGMFVGMNTAENHVEGDAGAWIEAEDSATFLAEIDFAGSDTAGPASSVAEALALGEIGFAALESFLRPFALGDVAVDAVDFGGVPFDLHGSGREGHNEARAVFSFARQFGINALAAPERSADFFRLFPVAFEIGRASCRERV